MFDVFLNLTVQGWFAYKPVAYNTQVSTTSKNI